MFTIHISIARHPSADYPFAVFTEKDGKRDEGMECRSVRDCYLVANGIAHGLMAARQQVDHVTKVDERIGWKAGS